MAAATDIGWALDELRSGAVSIPRVLETTARAFAISVEEMVAPGRASKATVLARQVAAYMAREKTVAGTKEIGRALGRDYTTIIQGTKAIECRLLTDAALARVVARLRAELEAP